MKIEDIKTVAIIGAGFIGPGIAQVFAVKGFSVFLMDIKEEMLLKARESLQANLQQVAEAGLMERERIESVVQKVQFTTDLTEALGPAQIAIEAVNENLELKQKIFRQMDSLCSPEKLLCTNTSVISITEIAAHSVHRERIVGTHFWNPPYLIPLVEVIKGKDTSDEALNLTFDFLKTAGKHPVKCLKDVPGFIANRLQHALWREAISLVENGIADAATVDEAIKNGFAVRLPALGPLENADMVGLDLTLAIHDYVLKSIESRPGPSPLLQDKVRNNDLGFKTGRGFYQWTPEKIKSSRENLTRYLLEWQKNQQSKTE
ncbi:MAG TPA: 3-hydroxyacyl-CoA dehydrogenase family protein [Dehalococcoidales bacterium]|nr:3-hydroxyacyl-CoA dehydrogenase family protein [Dehalococcoidales bacterium]